MVLVRVGNLVPSTDLSLSDVQKLSTCLDGAQPAHVMQLGQQNYFQCPRSKCSLLGRDRNKE
jgi:hypothetical protein